MKNTIILSFLGLSVLLGFGCDNQTKKETKNTEKKDKPILTQKQEKENKQLTDEKNTLFFDFEKYEIGKLPKDWNQYATGRGKETKWSVVNDNGNKVIAQLSSNRINYHFNEVIYSGLSVKNVKLTVKFKGVQGHLDQGGGLVWRFKDANNYYVVRANPLEDNVVLYKVENGVRSDLPLVGKGKTYGVNVNKIGNDWNTLSVLVQDSLFVVSMNGKELFRVIDTTFKDAGKIGLWTKADAVTYFDDLKATILN